VFSRVSISFLTFIATVLSRHPGSGCYRSRSRRVLWRASTRLCRRLLETVSLNSFIHSPDHYCAAVLIGRITGLARPSVYPYGILTRERKSVKSKMV